MGMNKYRKDLKQQAYSVLQEMLRRGVGASRRDGKALGIETESIHSFATLHDYWHHVKYFCNYVQEKHPECTTLRSAKKYVNEWIEYRREHGKANGEPLSAWTITQDRQALVKLYGMKPEDPNYPKVPARKRNQIKRSRLPVAMDAHFSEANHQELVKFCKATGCRRNVLEKLLGKDLISAEEMRAEIKRKGGLYVPTMEEEKRLKLMKESLDLFPDYEHFIHHYKDKGGRERYAPIIGANQEQVVARMKSVGPDEHVWKNVPVAADIHSYRAEYGTDIYYKYARAIEDIPRNGINKGNGRRYQKEVYVCRRDEKGKKLDAKALEKASKALGHNRIEVVATNYLREHACELPVIDTADKAYPPERISST